jgi:mRNA interferase MazF
MPSMKNFDDWHILKQELDGKDNAPLFKEREIWWCSVGVNVGYEIFGKDGQFTRPILVLRKFSHFTFFGLPLTSSRKDFPSYYPLNFRGKEGSVLLDQGRTVDARRLVRRMGRLTEEDAATIKAAFKDFL